MKAPHTIRLSFHCSGSINTKQWQINGLLTVHSILSVRPTNSSYLHQDQPMTTKWSLYNIRKYYTKQLNFIGQHLSKTNQ